MMILLLRVTPLRPNLCEGRVAAVTQLAAPATSSSVESSTS